MSNDDQLLGIAHDAMDRAVTLFNEATPKELTAKGDRDYATETDFRIERSLRDRLAKATPGIGFLGEEHGHTGNSERFWCLDPIDGTVNYVHGNPLCGISLALIEGDTPTIGVVDLPRLGDRYWASNAGAFRNGQRIQPAQPSQLADAIISLGDFAVGDDAAAKNESRLAVLAELVARVLRLRMVGSAATDLAWVADGKLDGTAIIGSHTWDLAAGIAIATAAGAAVETLPLGSTNMTVAGNPAVVDQLTATLITNMPASERPSAATK